MNKLSDKKINVLSLFTGAGGLDIGFHQAGFNIISCVEIEKIFCNTLELNRQQGKYLSKECRIFNQDIADFKTANLAERDHIDFVIGGPPCQTFSASGRRIGGAPGLDDNRGRLFEQYCRILQELQPAGFLFENVRGLLGVNGGTAWKAIVQSFSELGYHLSHTILDAAAYGVPQHRERIFLVGWKKPTPFLFPRPLYGPDSTSLQPYVTAGQALADLQNEAEPYHEYNGKYGYLLSSIPEGMNYSYYTAELGHPNPVFAWRSKFSSFLYKVSQDQPIKTLQAQLGKFAGPFHWKNRRLSIAELKRVQSFPDDYEFAGSYDQVVKQIGNSVPPLLATYLAQAVKTQLFEVTDCSELELMSLGFKQTFDSRKGRVAVKTRGLTTQAKHRETAVSHSLTQPKINIVGERYICYYINATKHTILSLQEDFQELKEKLTRTDSQLLFSVRSEPQRFDHSCLSLCITNLLPTTVLKPGWEITLNLNKPLDNGIKKIVATLISDDLAHIYVAWDALEKVITNYSAYMGLVALYGHFAEPHAKFDLEVKNLNNEWSGLGQLIEFYSHFSNCGQNIATDVVATKTGIERSLLPYLIRQMRDLRYDLRSHATNVRIPSDHYFCAYPFPELAAAYQVKKPV